jgi:alpha-ribazole phosphatase/probable phosphoglycerate mutase
LDLGLSEAGRTQIAEVAGYLAREPLSALYCSPRSRAVESAEILAGTDRKFQIVGDLAEIDFGDFEGHTYDEIAVCYPDLYKQWMEGPTKVHFPNGESFSQMRNRVLSAFRRLLETNDGQTIAVVSHGGVNRILIAWALEIPDHCLFRIAQPYAALSLLEFHEGIPSLRLLNENRERKSLCEKSGVRQPRPPKVLRFQ